ncbi:MAG: hypothetical protein P1U56_14420 [Saprospiraceae bacterium]|nr:hypothetical protein [Saprospiraceae bacterium]
MKNFTLMIFLLSILASCSPNRHLTADYDKFANRHSLIAVLPYDIQMRGRKVAEMDPEEVDYLRTVESRLFQQSLYSEVLKRSGRGKRDIKISVQDINKTNRLLKGAGIAMIDIAEYSPKELGEILGVDAIISTRLVKEMFLSREEALLVDVATTTILNRVPVTIPPFSKSKLTRSSEVDIFCTIVDTEAESAIWVYNTECDLHWDTDSDDAIENINGRISRNFPYK